MPALTRTAARPAVGCCTRRMQRVAVMTPRALPATTTQVPHPTISSAPVAAQLQKLAADAVLPVAALSVLALLAPWDATAAGDAAGMAAHAADHNTMQHLYDVAEEESLLATAIGWWRYIITVLLGTGYVMLKPLIDMYKNPVTGKLGRATWGARPCKHGERWC